MEHLNTEIGNTRRIILVIVSLLEVLLFGGIHYGWIPLLFVLMDEGLFLDLCHGNKTLRDNFNNSNEIINSDNITSCDERDELFNLIFALSLASVMFLSVLFGYLHFKMETKHSRILNKILFVLGALFVGFSSKDLPWLVLPGLIMIGCAGLSLMVSNMKITQVLKKGASIYVGVMSGCYGSSSFMQLLVKVLYQESIPKLYSYLGISFVFVIVTSLCTILHPSSPKVEIEVVIKEEELNYTNTGLAEEKKRKVNQKLPSLHSVLCSRPFLVHCMWASCIFLRYSFFLGSMFTHIESMAGTNNVSYFTNVLGYIMFGGVLSSYLAGHFSELQKMFFKKKLQKVLPLAMTSLLAIAVSILSFVNDVNALYVIFVTATCLRSFLFCMIMDFIIFTFPKEYMTVLYSTTITLTGAISLLQYALFSWKNKYEGALTHVNILCLCVSVISLVHPILITCDGVQNESDKSKRQKDLSIYNGDVTCEKVDEQNYQNMKN